MYMVSTLYDASGVGHSVRSDFAIAHRHGV